MLYLAHHSGQSTILWLDLMLTSLPRYKNYVKTYPADGSAGEKDNYSVRTSESGSEVDLQKKPQYFQTSAFLCDPEIGKSSPPVCLLDGHC